MTSVNPTGTSATGSTGGVTAPARGAATAQAGPPVTVWREKTSSYTGGTNGTGGPYGADGVASTFVARGTDVLMALLLAATAATTFLAATPWLRAYEVARAPLILALAAILPVVIAGGLSWVLRLQPVVSYAASAAGIAVFAWVVNGFDLGAVWDGVVHVPAQLLSETLPLSGSPYLLSAPVLLTWSCGAISAELFVRPTRPSSAGLLVPLAYFALAFVATTSAPAGAGVAAGVVLLGALMLCALARQAVLERQRALVEAGPEGRAARRSASLRSAVAGTALAALLVAALALAIPGSFSLSGKAATVSRSTHLRTGIVVDPLDALASLRDSDPGAPPVTLFKVSVQQSWSGYVALAALDDYDGDSWSFSATFRPTGGRVPEPTIGATTGGERVVQHYTLERAIGLPFLPAQDRPVQVTGVPADADATTGMLTAAPSLPASYTVVSRVPAGTLSELNPGSPIAFGDNVPGGDLPAYIALPAGSAKDIAPAARFAAHLTGEKVSPTLTFLQALAVALQGHERRVSPDAAANSGQGNSAALAGTSLAQVMNAVTVDRAATPEQFATFYAVVARYLGVPARVVTGFMVPAAASSQAPVPAGDYTLTNRDAWTWVELPVMGVGWVIVDPTPVATTAAASPPPEQVRATPTTVPRQATALPGSGAAHAIAPHVKVKPSHAVPVNWPLVLGTGVPAAIILGILVAVLLVPAVRRRLRRSARHRPRDPALLAAGAWLELLDGASRLGLEVPPSATSSEVADQLAEHFGDQFGPPAKSVGAVADQAIYSSLWPVDAAEAKSAWDSQDRLNEALFHSAGYKAKARALMKVGNAPTRPSQRAGR